MAMKKQSPKAESEILQLKITLKYTKPPIWRRMLVPSQMRLSDLHHVIQRGFGWHGSHLHEFTAADGESFGASDPFGDLMGGPGEAEPGREEGSVRLHEVAGFEGAKLEYTYDFGDSWEHSIVVEKVLPPDPALTYPVCMAGARKGPPEDCGGVPGFYHLLDVLADPSHPERKEMLGWLGEAFDPNDFSVERVNALLGPAKRAGRSTRKKAATKSGR